MSQTVEELARSGAIHKARDIYAEALTVHYRLLDILVAASDSWRKWKEPNKTQWHSQAAAQFVIDTHRAMAKILPTIKGLENLKAIHKIFDDLADQKIDIVRASLDLAKMGVALPKPVEILLTKHRPDEAPLDAGEILTDEMIMQRRAEILARIDNERVEFIPERKKLVAALKAETRYSFKAQETLNKLKPN